MAKYRTLLVDDSALFIKWAIRFFSTSSAIEIIGTASSGREALQRVQDLNPDLVLMDIWMPDMDGYEATRYIKHEKAHPAVIIVTFEDTPEKRVVAAAAGADGFIEKSQLKDSGLELIQKFMNSRKGNSTDEKMATD